MPSKSEIKKAGFSINAITNQQAEDYENNFRDAFGVDANATQLQPQGTTATSNKSIKIDKLGIFVSKKALRDIIKKMTDTASDGIVLKFGLDANDQIELIANNVKFENSIPGDFSHRSSTDVYSSAWCQHCQPQPIKIPPPRTLGHY